MAEQDNMQQLVKRIRARRKTIDAFLMRARPRADRLTLVSIVSSAVAAALTAAPALGGKDFMSAAVRFIDGAEAPDVWQPLCLLAMIASIVAAISANLSKSKNAEARILNAEVCNAELDALQAAVEFQQIPLEDAVKQYQKHIAKIPFVAEQTAAKGRSSRRVRS
jgi:hypothetical protein